MTVTDLLNTSVDSYVWTP